ncbi:MAG: sulfatase-like hydrolase/transferase [Alphaproteobacteria bacterium]|nr:sulfatase-like hydrolase/transferase [Alphaproteobacteria bacterium]
MKNKIEANGFETAVISFLLILAMLPALSAKATFPVALFNGAAIVGLYTIARRYLALLHPAMGIIFFAFAAAAIATEIVLFHFTSLHVSWFVLSLALQPQAAVQIGLPGLTLSCLLLFIAALIIGRRQLRMRWRISLKGCITATAGLFILAQLSYTFLLFERNIGLLGNRQHLVFFKGPHHYHANMIFEPILGPQKANPFAQPYERNKAPLTAEEKWAISQPKNLLLIVVDSLRAKDIAADPALAPNLMRWSTRGQLSLTHSSVSNCTHFSMHTLFTGDYATSFGAMRHSGMSWGLFAGLAQNGYRLTSAEAQNLDWYELSRTYLSDVSRTVASDGPTGERDTFVANETIERLMAPSQQPVAHLAYFNGPHFPYDKQAPSLQEGYKSKIRETDSHIGRILDTLSDAGALRDTLVIITADHGEQLTEDGVIGHGSLLNHEQTMVPLLIIGANNRTDWIRSHRDILPAIKAELDAAPVRMTEQPFQLLMGCDYEFPSRFAYVDAKGKVEFRYNEGLLTPLLPTGNTDYDKKRVTEAGLEVIKVLQR